MRPGLQTLDFAQLRLSAVGVGVLMAEGVVMEKGYGRISGGHGEVVVVAVLWGQYTPGT